MLRDIHVLVDMQFDIDVQNRRQDTRQVYRRRIPHVAIKDIPWNIVFHHILIGFKVYSVGRQKKGRALPLTDFMRCRPLLGRQIQTCCIEHSLLLVVLTQITRGIEHKVMHHSLRGHTSSTQAAPHTQDQETNSPQESTRK